jgi:alpha-L-arabinofuranosidase
MDWRLFVNMSPTNTTTTWKNQTLLHQEQRTKQRYTDMIESQKKKKTHIYIYIDKWEKKDANEWFHVKNRPKITYIR